MTVKGSWKYRKWNNQVGMEIHYCAINTHLHVRRIPCITSSKHLQLNLKSFKVCTSFLYQWVGIYILLIQIIHVNDKDVEMCRTNEKNSNIIHSNAHSNLVKLCSPKQYISWLINVNRHMYQSIWTHTHTHTHKHTHIWPFKWIKQSQCELDLCGMLCSIKKRNIKYNQKELPRSTRQAPCTNLIATK